MILATFLSWGWPKEQTRWINRGESVPAGLVARKFPSCCGSMRPTFHGGEVGYWEKYYPGMELHEGEVVDDGRASHRIVALSEKGVRLSGDANSFSDPWESRDNIQWVLRYAVRP